MLNATRNRLFGEFGSSPAITTAGTAHALLARASPKRRDGPEEEGPLLERQRRGGEARRWRHELLPGACPPGRVV